MAPIIPPYVTALLKPRVVALVLTALFPWQTTFIFFTGLYLIGGTVFNLFRMILHLTVWPSMKLEKFGAKKGAWAVITGATDGIGLEFALQLAKKGFNVFLISRNPGKLVQTSSRIQSQSPSVQVKTHAIDFADATPHAYADLEKALQNVNVGVLVNNVGHSSEIPATIATSTPSSEATIATVNIIPALRVTTAVLHGMVDRKTGLILNVGSLSGHIGVPMLATYSASKAFLETWTQALGRELAGTGVLVQVVNTYYVASKLSGIVKPSIITPSPRAFVRATLSHINLPCGSVGVAYSSTPYWVHAFMDFGLRNFGLGWIAAKVGFSMQNGIREKALQKKSLKSE